MTELPESWCIMSIGDIAYVGTGATPKRGNPTYYDNGTIPWVTSAAVNDSEVSSAQEFVTETALHETNLTLYEPGTLLVAMYGEGKTRGKCAELRIWATTNQALAAIVLPPSAAAWRKWVQYALEYQYEETRKLASGGVQPNLNLGLIKRIEIPFAPERCQRRVIDTMESYFTRLDDTVATLERVDRNLKRYRASVLKAAVEGRLVPTEAALAKQEARSYEPASVLLERILTERRRRWSESGKKGKYEEPAPPDITNLPGLPEGWCWATLEQVCSQIVDCPHSTPKWANEGHICVRTTEFLPGRLVLDRVRFVSQATYEERIQRLRPEAGDILFSREGGILGIACQVPYGVELCLGQRMMLMRAARQTSARYLVHVLNSPLVQMRVRGLTGGSASPHLNVGDIKGFLIPFPPEAEAVRISAAIDNVLSVIDSTDADVAVNMSRAARLRQSILKWAFEGRLVDQDPRDEPASMLLERIKAERETGKPAKATALERAAKKKQVRA